jgi:hypothetical protein
MMSAYLSELVKIEPFSVDTLSGGSPKLFHPATVASSERTDNGLGIALIGMLFLAKKSRKFSLMILSLNCLLKGPT